MPKLHIAINMIAFRNAVAGMIAQIAEPQASASKTNTNGLYANARAVSSHRVAIATNPRAAKPACTIMGAKGTSLSIKAPGHSRQKPDVIQANAIAASPMSQPAKTLGCPSSFDESDFVDLRPPMGSITRPA